MIPFTDRVLLVTITRRGRGDRVVELAKEAGASGATVLFGRGTAGNRFVQFLCLGDTGKELVFIIETRDEILRIIKALQDAPDLCRKCPGVGFTLDVSTFLRAGPSLPKVEMELQIKNTRKECCGKNMDKTSDYELISVIVNAGFADDIMQTAREAGAPGGTIIKARGTGTKMDSGFFGITIVPEKEMLLLLAPRDISPAILAAVRSSPCLAEPGVGIVYCMPVTDFFALGKK